MAIYKKTTKELMPEWIHSNLEPGKEVQTSQVVDWFAANYPKIKSNTVSMHVEGFATNNARHRSHHDHIREGTGWDLLYKVASRRFRLWDPSTDPAPMYDLGSLPEAAARDADAEFDPDESNDYDPNTIREFAYERDLQNYLARNIGVIEPGLKVYEDDGFKAIEYDAGGRRIDILAIDRKGQFVVIELKASKAYDRVVGQISRYMAWVSTHMESKGTVRGIIIASDPSYDLLLAASIVPNLDIMRYQLRFDVEKVAQLQ